MYKLVIAEKKSVAESLSAVLGAKERKGGYFIGKGYVVSWCAGHLLELAPPDAYDEKYAKWRHDDLPIIPNTWKYIPSKGKEAQLKQLTELMNRSDVECIINACDAGREGENIFRHVYNFAGCNKKILRLWIASLEPAAIKAGFDNLKDGAKYENLYAAAYCRERADWLVGINSTRLFSTLYGTTLNTGRVQSPTLAMLVRRGDEISSFIKEPFYIPVIRCNQSDDHANFTAFGNKFKDKQAAESIRTQCDGKQALITKLEHQPKTVAPPKLYDLTTLQREANRIFGYTAQQTLDYAQSLYEKALMSYPRVDSRYLTSDMHSSVSSLVDLIQAGAFPAFTWELPRFTPDINRLISDKDVTDHHAIIPTSKITQTDLAALPSGERELLSFVVVRLLCATAPTHCYESITATVECSGHTFTSKSKAIEIGGWKLIEAAYKGTLTQNPEQDSDKDYGATLPKLDVGQVIADITAHIKDGSTTPPKHYTEDTVLSAMETHGAVDMPENAERRGLGTPATRAAIIEKIIKSGFVERQKKKLISTDKGKNLIMLLPDALAVPKLTADWEHMLKQVEMGKLSDTEFMQSITEFIKSVVADNKTPKPEFIRFYASAGTNTNSTVGNCPRCKSDVREGNKGFFCGDAACEFKIWKDSKFWTAKKVTLTAEIVSMLLRDGHIALKGLHSEKTGRTYDATIILDSNSEKYVNFKLSFGKRGA